jgi:hypothetical protein
MTDQNARRTTARLEQGPTVAKKPIHSLSGRWYTQRFALLPLIPPQFKRYLRREQARKWLPALLLVILGALAIALASRPDTPNERAADDREAPPPPPSDSVKAMDGPRVPRDAVPAPSPPKAKPTAGEPAAASALPPRPSSSIPERTSTPKRTPAATKPDSKRIPSDSEAPLIPKKPDPVPPHKTLPPGIYYE